MAGAHYFTDGQVMRLKTLLEAYERGELRSSPPGAKRPPPNIPPGGHLVQCDASIAATTSGSTTISSGTASVFKFTGTNTVADTSINITVYNTATTAASTGEWMLAHKELRSGRFMLGISTSFRGHVAYIGYGDTITARSGTTPGSGTVTLYKRSGGVLVSTSETVTAYNCTLATPASDQIYIQIKQDPYGDWWWDVDDCVA